MAIQNKRQLTSTLFNSAGGGNKQRTATLGAYGNIVNSLKGVVGEQVAPGVITADADNFTPENVAGGIAVTTPTGAVADCESPTAAEFFSTFSLTDINDSAEFTIINLSANALHEIIFSGGTNVTTVGHVTLAGVNSGTFRVRKSSSTAAILYRIA